MDPLLKKKIEDIFDFELNDFANCLKSDFGKGGSKFKNIKAKKNNFLISSLSTRTMVFSALMRSLDSSLGNRIEKIALQVASVCGYKVSQGVDGEISSETITLIATLLEQYKAKNNNKKVHINDLKDIRRTAYQTQGKSKFHNSDYLLEKTKDGIKYLTLLELKAGGDLDNKKARSEKEAILEQYAILVKEHQAEIENGTTKVRLYFGTAYNKNELDGGKNEWSQASVRAFFSEQELLIGKEFWNYICDSEDGWEVVKECYEKNSTSIDEALNNIVDSTTTI